MPELSLRKYDIIVVSSSSGKDSQTALRVTCNQAKDEGVLDRVVVVHADLGEVEWPGEGALAAYQASLYGVPYIETSQVGVVAEVGGAVYARGEPYGTWLDYTERRGFWPSLSNRYCTSEYKRRPIERIYTALARRWREGQTKKGPCLILDVQGLRAQESERRRRLPMFSVRKETGNQVIHTWLPIHQWTTDQVWEDIRRSKVPYHAAYALGNERLSCALCIIQGQNDARNGARHNGRLLREFIRIERAIQHTFRDGWSIENLTEYVQRDKPAYTARGQMRCGCIGRPGSATCQDIEEPAGCMDVEDEPEVVVEPTLEDDLRAALVARGRQLPRTAQVQAQELLRRRVWGEVEREIARAILA